MTTEKAEPDTLLPCPFCGTNAQIVREDDLVSVACMHYYCNFSQIALHSEKKAIERWNTRAAPPRCDAQREELKWAIERCAKIAEPWIGFWPLDSATEIDHAIIAVRTEIAKKIRAISETEPARRDAQEREIEPTPAMVDAALDAWFKSPPSETDQGLERSMKAALVAAHSLIVSCPRCGRSVLEVNQPAAGWIAPCGRRLVILSECGNSAACSADDEQMVSETKPAQGSV